MFGSTSTRIVLGVDPHNKVRDRQNKKKSVNFMATAGRQRLFNVVFPSNELSLHSAHVEYEEKLDSEQRQQWEHVIRVIRPNFTSTLRMENVEERKLRC